MKLCSFCNKLEAYYRGKCLNCAQLFDELRIAKRTVLRWDKPGRKCNCRGCKIREVRDRAELEQLIAVAVDVKANGW